MVARARVRGLGALPSNSASDEARVMAAALSHPVSFFWRPNLTMGLNCLASREEG